MDMHYKWINSCQALQSIAQAKYRRCTHKKPKKKFSVEIHRDVWEYEEKIKITIDYSAIHKHRNSIGMNQCVRFWCFFFSSLLFRLPFRSLLVSRCSGLSARAMCAPIVRSSLETEYMLNYLHGFDLYTHSMCIQHQRADLFQVKEIERQKNELTIKTNCFPRHVICRLV